MVSPAAVLKIENAIYGLLQTEERAKRLCEQVKDSHPYDFAAIQISDLLKRAIRPVYSTSDSTMEESGRQSKCHRIASHPLDTAEQFRDIQAHIALACPQ
jgi:hypothetical protein